MEYAVFNSNQAKLVDNLNPTSNDDIRYAARAVDNYWYPNMSKSELNYVKSIAKYELGVSNNYIDQNNKWLYNKKNGNSYFAIYSTIYDESPTILYACKGEMAEKEYSFLVDIIEKGETENVDKSSRIIDSILEFLESAQIDNNLHSIGSSSGRISNRNAGLYSKNKRRGLSKAYLNCIRNIAEVYSRGLESTKYQSRASMTEERINFLIEDSGAGSRKDYAQSWITSINPTDFLNLTLGKNNQDRNVFDTIPGDYGKNFNEYDYIEGLPCFFASLISFLN